jgi:hypothetical protein
LATGDSSIHRNQSANSRLLDIRVSHDGYAAHAEPYLAVNPRNPRNLLGAAQFFQTSTSLPRAGTFTSFDGGHTWPRQGPLPTPSDLPVAFDTTVAFNARGVGFVAALTVAVINGRASDIRGISIWRTDNGGRSFHGPVMLARGRLLDHPWLTADPAGGTLYLVWDDLVRNTILFSRSSNGGSGFSPGRTVYRGGLVGDPVVAAGPRGHVAAIFYHSRDGRQYSVGTVSSSSQGRSFGRFQVIPQTLQRRLLYAGKGDPSSRVGAAMDPHTGTLFATYAAYPRTGASHTEILLSRSTDAGRTWLSPVRVEHDPAGVETINQQPQVAVGQRGEVDVSYLAQRGSRMDVYLGQSDSSGSSFQHTLRVTGTSFDPSLGIRTIRRGSWWIGDYQGLAAGPGLFFPFWNDTRTGRLEIFTAIIPQVLVRHSNVGRRRS